MQVTRARVWSLLSVVVVVVTSALGCSGSSAGAGGDQSGPFRGTAELLATRPQAIDASAVSPDARRIAFVARLDGGDKRQVLVNAQPVGGKFDQVGAMWFAQEGNAFGYLARDGARWLAVIDGAPGKGVENPLRAIARVSGEGRRVALPFTDADGKHVMVIDGQHGPAYDAVGAAVFSPGAGTRVGYVARAGDKFRVVIDGVEGPPYDWSSDPAFEHAGAARSGRVVYLARRGAQGLLVVDGAETAVQPRPVQGPVFSPAGGRLAYLAVRDDGLQQLVIDGQAGPAMPSINLNSLAFSPDGRRSAYAAEVSDGVVKVVVDGRLQDEAYRAVPHALFSPDGYRLALVAADTTDDRLFTVVDGVRGERVHSVARDSVRFSPDSRRFLYTAQPVKDRDEQALIVYGKRLAVAKSITDPRFSPDGRHTAQVENGDAVVDGRKVNGPYRVYNSGTLEFEDDAHVRFLGVRGAGREIFRVVADLAP